MSKTTEQVKTENDLIQIRIKKFTSTDQDNK